MHAAQGTIHNLLLPSNSQLLEVKRLPEHLTNHYEIKDPSIVAISHEKYMMYASVGNSKTQTWIVGRFIAHHPTGPWTEVAPVKFVNLSGPQLCAPAVTYTEEYGQGRWVMYIQTSCFEENGIIAVGESTDGETFYGKNTAVTRESIVENKHQVVGVYDAGISDVRLGTDQIECMLFSGYRKVGNGDIYMTYRKKFAAESSWTPAKCLLAQEDVPFHNHPTMGPYEWGLEGAKLIQLATDSYLLIGVCFLPEGEVGSRQRVFFAGATNLSGPFIPLGVPFLPQHSDLRSGEHGHPDTVVLNDELWIIYQERSGDGQPWHLRSTKYSVDSIRDFVNEQLTKKQKQTVVAAQRDEVETPTVPVTA